jgi:carbonic anhydrase
MWMLKIGAAIGLLLGSAVPLASGPVTAAEALARLKAGNARFVADPQAAMPIDAARRAAAVERQRPMATVLSCADSRVPPEVIFHAALGDLFVVRAAGAVADRAVLASVEYGAEHLHIPLIVVMGHEFCGAVKAAIETPVGKSAGPNLDFLIKAIRPAVAATAASPEATRLRAAILRNVEDTVNDLVDDSAIVKTLAQAGKVTLVGAYYELASGRVHFSEPVGFGAGAPVK